MRVHILVVRWFFVSDGLLFWLVRNICWTKQHWCIEWWGLYLWGISFSHIDAIQGGRGPWILQSLMVRHVWRIWGSFVHSMFLFVSKDMLQWWPVCWRILLKKFEGILGILVEIARTNLWERCRNIMKHHCARRCETSGNSVREILPKDQLLL